MKYIVIGLLVLGLAGCKKKVSDYEIAANLPKATPPIASEAAKTKNAHLITPQGRNSCHLLKEGGLKVTCSEKLKQCKADKHQAVLIDNCMRKELGDVNFKTLQKAYRQERGESWKEEGSGIFGF